MNDEMPQFNGLPYAIQVAEDLSNLEDKGGDIYRLVTQLTQLRVSLKYLRIEMPWALGSLEN